MGLTIERVIISQHAGKSHLSVELLQRNEIEGAVAYGNFEQAVLSDEAYKATFNVCGRIVTIQVSKQEGGQG